MQRSHSLRRNNIYSFPFFGPSFNASQPGYGKGWFTLAQYFSPSLPSSGGTRPWIFQSSRSVSMTVYCES